MGNAVSEEHADTSHHSWYTSQHMRPSRDLTHEFRALRSIKFRTADVETNVKLQWFRRAILSPVTLTEDNVFLKSLSISSPPLGSIRQRYCQLCQAKYGGVLSRKMPVKCPACTNMYCNDCVAFSVRQLHFIPSWMFAQKFCQSCAHLMHHWYRQRHIAQNDAFVSARTLFDRIVAEDARIESLLPQAHGIMLTLQQEQVGADPLPIATQSTLVQTSAAVIRDIRSCVDQFERLYQEIAVFEWDSFDKQEKHVSPGQSLWALFGRSFQAWAMKKLKSARIELKKAESMLQETDKL